MKIAVVGIGRIGALHARHTAELNALAAVVDTNFERARTQAASLSQIQGEPVQAFASVEDLAESGICKASFIATPTDCHHQTAAALVAAGHRVLLEKPLTGSLAADREFAKHLDEHHPHALMLAFNRRFDAPLQYAKRLMDEGAIGRVFKIVSALEDSNPAPNGYVSEGILADMSIHNVDEILWFAGEMPTSAAAIGNCLYSRKLSTAVEDFDDAFLYMWFKGEMSAQVMVSRNHVSGYRVETWIFGEKGQIHIGRFEQDRFEVVVEAYGRSAAIERKVFGMRDYGPGVPEFMDRFGPAYKAELQDFIARCESGEPFTVTHRDGLRAMEVIDAGMRGSVQPGEVQPA